MAIEWLDHPADIGVRVTGATLDAVFEESASALFSIMVSVDAISPTRAHRVKLSSPTLDDLLVMWLSELLVQRDLTGLVFSRFEVTIHGTETGGYVLEGTGWGEQLDVQRHNPRTEVKGISYLGLSVGRHEGHWIAQVVVDV
jgi:SHS2 domain-containing protein